MKDAIFMSRHRTTKKKKTIGIDIILRNFESQEIAHEMQDERETEEMALVTKWRREALFY